MSTARDLNAGSALSRQHHEAFSEIIARFGRLLRCQADVQSRLIVPELQVPPLDHSRFQEGEPLLAGVDPASLRPLLCEAARDVWPCVAAEFPELAADFNRLSRKLHSSPVWTGLCVQAMLEGREGLLNRVSREAKTDRGVMLMALRAAWKPVAGAIRPVLAAGVDVSLWRQPYCPVCGSDPDLSTLENHADQNEFLISKSGETWHHCPSCGQHWRFVRMACAGCGCQDHEKLNRLSIPDRRHEFIYTCEECRQYLPCLNLIENPATVDLDSVALDLVHLDAVAQTRGYSPLSPAPWTVLGLVGSRTQD